MNIIVKINSAFPPLPTVLSSHHIKNDIIFFRKVTYKESCMTITMKSQVVAFEEGRQRRIDIMKCFLNNTGKTLRRFLTFLSMFLSLYLSMKMLIYILETPTPDLDNTGDLLIHESKKLEKDQPGFFMKGTYPLNNTFCRFNYGLPKKLDWQLAPISGTPQLGKKSPYRVIYNAIERSMFDSSYTMDKVTYATHVTPDFLYHIVEIARFWDGPISVTAFVPNYDLDITMKLFTQLCRCYDGMAKVAVHLMYPITDMPILLNHPKKAKNISTKLPRKLRKQTEHGLRKGLLNKDPIVPGEQNKKVDSLSKNTSLNTVTVQRSTVHNFKHFINIDFKDCSTPNMGETRTYRSRHGLVYPVNVARNVARKASETQYNLVSDVELIPSDGLATKFTGMVRRQKINGHYGRLPKWRLAFVIPVFEVEQGEDIPRNKSRLVNNMNLI